MTRQAGLVAPSFTARSAEAAPWPAPATRHTAPTANGHSPRHGTVDHPRSRAAAIRDKDPSLLCEPARELNTSTTWQEVLPGAARMLADQTVTYDYTAYHTNETWPHRWYIT
ncbi:hypothetical protein [Kitasatospora sp. NPDC050543]|uniref:hypothetical protein n=1 Tax=Kitasatospora sp. NPDC050543 TaxID=3364054 RepID=UPI00378B0115